MLQTLVRGQILEKKILNDLIICLYHKIGVLKYLCIFIMFTFFIISASL